MNNYFSHDSNARNSDKLLPVRMKYGAEGYGIYFMILERLREEKNYMSVKDYNMLAFDLRVDTGKLKSIVEDFGLFAFTDDGKCFYSEGFNKRMEIKDEKSKKRSEAGKKGAAKRWQSDSNAIAKPTDSDSKKRKEKETKEKEREEKQKNLPAASNSDLSEIYAFWEQNGYGSLAPVTRENLAYWVTDFQEIGATRADAVQIVLFSLLRGIEGKGRTYNYIDSILKSWEGNRFLTVSQIKAEDPFLNKLKKQERPKLSYEQDDDEEPYF